LSNKILLLDVFIERKYNDVYNAIKRTKTIHKTNSFLAQNGKKKKGNEDIPNNMKSKWRSKTS